MRVLIVGAGAVGQVYGRHLQLGGAEVSFLVKPKHAETARQGFTMYPLNGMNRGVAVRFEGFGVLTDASEAAGTRWDQLWLAVSSPALKGDWLPALLSTVQADTLVMLQPSLGDRELLLQHWPAERLVTGLIAFIAYGAPLPGEERFSEPGIAYWFPPLGPSPFSGPDAKRAVDALKAGGCPAVVGEQVHRQSAWPSAALNLHVAALETVGWSWDAARSGDTLDLASRAAREAMEVNAARLGRRRPPTGWRLGVRPPVARLLMRLAPNVIPLDIETYLQVHFTKVGDQTRQHLAGFIEEGKARGLDVGAMVELARRLEAARGRS